MRTATLSTLSEVRRRGWPLLSAIVALAACQSKAEPPPPTDAPPSIAEALQNETAPLPQKPLEPGDAVFDFSALGHTGQSFRLSEFLSRPVVVYFCPDDRAPACTALAIAVRDDWLALSPSVSMVFGVSPQDTFVHRDFASEHELPFLLVADTESSLHQVFGVPVGTVRAYLIGTDRKVVHTLAPPSAALGQDLLNALRSLGLEQPVPPI